jgi:hypothetical protein
MRCSVALLAVLFGVACSDSGAGAKTVPGHGGNGNHGGSGGNGGPGPGAQGGGAPFEDGGDVTVPCGIFLGGAVRNHPYVKGTHHALKWAEIEPTKGEFDFEMFERQTPKIEGGRKLAIRMTGSEPLHVVDEAADTWTWIDPNMAHDECQAPVGCVRPAPWDGPTLDRYQAMVSAIAADVVTIDGVSQALAEHPGLESVMLTLPGWGRIRELGFEIEDLPGYTREKVITATLDALRMQADAFPGKSVFTQFFIIDDGDEPPLWEEMRDAILGDSSLDRVGFYEENLAHGFEGTEEVFRPSTDAGAPLYTSKDQTFTGFQMLTAWADPSASYADAVNMGSPAAAMEWALETYNSRYFEVYAQDIDAATDGTHPDWEEAFEAVSEKLCKE